ncbi:MAG: hypothetical protein KF810_02365 [Rhizobiaceae bacterium]|nr:hypothetical protein [Rhizobiaceae bacterium]
MSTAQFWVPIAIEVVAGALSAALLARLVPPLSLGRLMNVLVGAVGGIALTWITGRIPALEKFVEPGAGDPTVLTSELLVGVGVAGLIGGALFVAIGGLLRNQLRN